MGLPGHRRTSSHKRRRASHFALKLGSVVKDATTGTLHLPHRAAPGAMTYNGKPIHVKPSKRKAEKAAKRLQASKK
ncbi:MAG TPA: 50S ribosomal protein L32 [Candidatus Methylomirabilis sp.]|nr:50S ribosomal protein L32 [Candidatus Methylomirabilis sp.]